MLFNYYVVVTFLTLRRLCTRDTSPRHRSSPETKMTCTQALHLNYC